MNIATRSTNRWTLLTLFTLLLMVGVGGSEAWGQGENKHTTWTQITKSVTGKPGDNVEVAVKVVLVKKAHLYTEKTYSGEGPSPTEVTVGEASVITKRGKLRSSKKPINHFDPNFSFDGDSVYTEYWEGTVTLTVPLKISKNAKPGEYKSWVNFSFMTCDERICIPPTDKKFEFSVIVAEAEDSTAVTGADTADVDTTALADIDTTTTDEADTSLVPTDAATASASPDNEKTINEQIEDKKKEGLIPFILFAMGFGFLALTTPCVFPMIPITISFFTKREQNSRIHAIRDASVYGLGIIATFTLLGVVVSAIYGAPGVGDIATNPWINILIATIFITFALNLFGLFEIQVPSSILNRLNAKANQGSGVTSILLMGLVFSLTSFTCTVPFVGSVLTGAGGGEWFWPVIGMLAFSLAFALPFFLLAMFPSWLKAMPKSGGWLNAVKVTMGFVEIAAAMKFLSNTDLIWDWGILTREIVLAIWISVAILASFYLLGRFRLPHDTPLEKIGVVRMLFSMGFLAIGFWLLTGLFGGRLGEIDAFLPPQEYPGKGNTSILASISESGGSSSEPIVSKDSNQIIADSASGGGSSEPVALKNSNRVMADGMEWIQDDYAMALKEAKETGKPLFVDFTGYTCTNCRWMERNVFTRDDVRDLMNQYVLVRLYTDRREESNKRNRQMQIDRFETIDLPFYALFSPDDKVLGQSVFTRDVEKFKGFLQRGIEQGKIVKGSSASPQDEEVASR
ncbi:MAG: cytochrome c biogenesis protein CcdA [Candidatus Kapaibacterium sp.]